MSGRLENAGDGSAERGLVGTRRRSRAATATALFLASFAYLYAFRNEGIFHLDAIYLAQAVEAVYASGSWDVHWRFGAVLANALVYFPFWLSGEDAERATIVASILFHAASIAMLFLFLERLSGNSLQAVLSAGLLAVAPVYSVANTFGKEYGLAVLLVATSFLLAVAARDTGSGLRAAGSAACFAVSFVVWEGLLAITPIYLVALFAPRGEPLARGPRARRLVVGALAGLAVGVVFGLSTSLASTIRTYAASRHMTGFLGLASPALGVALGDLRRFLGSLFLLMSLCGLGVGLAHRRYRAVLPLAVLLVASVLFYGNLSTYGPRYLVLSAIGLSMLAGAGFHFLLTRSRPMSLAAMVAYLCAVTSMVAIAHPLLAPRHAYNGAKRYAQLIAEVTEPDSVIIVMDDSRFVEYYARRATLQHPIGDRAATAIWVQTVRDTLAHHSVYLAQSGLSYDPGGIVGEAIDANFLRTLVGTRLSEDYHHAERRLKVYEAQLWRLTPR